MTRVPVAMELYVCAQLTQCLNPPLHHSWRRNAIGSPTTTKVDGSLVEYSEWPV